MSDEVRRVAEIVRSHLSPEVSAAALNPDADLAELGLTSLETIALIVDIERTLSIVVPADRLDARAFVSVRTICNLVIEILQAGECDVPS